MEFVEAPAFARHRERYLSDEDFRHLQETLTESPGAGEVIPGTGGVRKLRWQDVRRGKGRRGGLRIIYYCFFADNQIYLLTLYNKGELKDLTAEQKKQLRAAIEEEKYERNRKPDS